MNEISIEDTIVLVRQQVATLSTQLNLLLDQVDEQIKLIDKEKVGVREQKIINEQTKRVFEEKTRKVQELLDSIGS